MEEWKADACRNIVRILENYLELYTFRKKIDIPSLDVEPLFDLYTSLGCDKELVRLTRRYERVKRGLEKFIKKEEKEEVGGEEEEGGALKSLISRIFGGEE